MNTIQRILGEAARPPKPHELTDPMSAFYYAYHVLAGPFPEGENVIATDANASFQYATLVLDKRFLAGEEAIGTSDDPGEEAVDDYAYSGDNEESYSGEQLRTAYIDAFPDAKLDFALKGWIDWDKAT